MKFACYRLLPFLTIIFACSLAFSQVSFQNAFPNSTFQFPVEIQHANDNSNRLFVVEQPGKIKVFDNNSSITNNDINTFIDISSDVAYSTGQEIGLLGLAFHPLLHQMVLCICII